MSRPHSPDLVSFELAHVTPHDLRRDGDIAQIAEQHVARGRSILDALVGRERASCVILVDDYFNDDASGVEQQLAAVLDACEQQGILVDHVVRESSCTDVAPMVLAALADAPRPGDGATMTAEVSESEASRDASWLSSFGRRRIPSGQARKSSDGGSLLSIIGEANATGSDPKAAQPEPHRGHVAAQGYHEINLEIQLFDGGPEALGPGTEGKWSCPWLAACWQLLRLGVLRDDSGDAITPADEGIVHPALSREPRSFSARSTLTVLPPHLIEVEHAVRLILGHLELDPVAVRHLNRSGQDADRRPADLVLERIAYCFAPLSHPAFG